MQRVRVIPTVKVEHVCPPISVQTDCTSFRNVVQELTGKRKRTCVCDRLEGRGVDKPFLSIGRDDSINPAIASVLNGQNQLYQCARSMNFKPLPLSDMEWSPHKSETWSNSYSDDSQQEVTSALLDCIHAPFSTVPRLKKSKLGVSHRQESPESKSSTPDREETGSPEMIQMDMLISSFLPHEEALYDAPKPTESCSTSPSSTGNGPSAVAPNDIFFGLHDDLQDDLNPLLPFLLS